VTLLDDHVMVVASPIDLDLAEGGEPALHHEPRAKLSHRLARALRHQTVFGRYAPIAAILELIDAYWYRTPDSR
jgi:hypothetical protein